MDETQEKHEPVMVPFSELRSGDKFRIPGDGHLYICTKVHQKYVIDGTIGARTLNGFVPVELVSKAVPREPKEVEL